MKMSKKWMVFCKKDIDEEEWVYAASKEEAMQVIRDNFHELTPCYAEEIKPKIVTKYCMGFAYRETIDA
jgi:hypothetical protein